MSGIGPSAAAIAKGLRDISQSGEYNDNCRMVTERYDGGNTFQMTYEGQMDSVVYTVTVVKGQPV